MEIVCKVFGRGSRLVQALEMKGYTPREKNGSVVFLLKKNGKKHEIPLKKRFKLFIRAKEERLNGKAIVVCSINGRKIKACRYPFYFFQNGTFEKEALCTVKAYKKNSTVTITEHEVMFENGFAKIISRCLWSGKAPTKKWSCVVCGKDVVDHHCPECFAAVSRSRVSLPDHLKDFEPAVIAAKEKSECKMCSCTHYAL